MSYPEATIMGLVQGLTVYLNFL